MKKSVMMLCAAAALLSAGSARAETNPLSVTATTDGSWSLSFTTSVLPKGWFNEGNQFVRTKTTLVADVTALQAECSNALQSDARVSTADGSIVIGTALNASGKNVTGYYWQYNGWDLTNLRNSYSLQYACDGSTTVRGCDATRPIALTVTASDKDGVRTYVDANGVAQPVTFTVSGLSLPAYHDAANDQAATGCTDADASCGIGPCQSACEASCKSGQAGKECREACECSCKVASFEATGGVCHAQDKCISQ